MKEGQSMEMIKQAAVKCGDTIYTLPRPKRHPDIYEYIYNRVGLVELRKGVDGFLTDTNRFVDRCEAYEIANNANQIISEDATPAALYTEDLY
jgi:hypothetical protein